MKKSIFLSAILLVLIHTINAQNDTMYIMKDGMIINKQSIKATDVDSVIFYQPQPATSGTFTDSRDGNVYKWVKIGKQVWMAENLRYLPSVVGPATASATTPYYYVYDYDGTDVAAAKATVNYTIYGVLYNWPAAMAGSASSTANPSGVKGVCPTGWHLPSDAEWTQLTDYLGGESVAGGKLKEIGTTNWESPNTGATNETGFTARPGGSRHATGGFFYFEAFGNWWSATLQSSNYAYEREMRYNDCNVKRTDYFKEVGYSVRCIKD